MRRQTGVDRDPGSDQGHDVVLGGRQRLRPTDREVLVGRVQDRGGLPRRPDVGDPREIGHRRYEPHGAGAVRRVEDR